MNHRQRFMAVLNGEQPDRTPVLANLTIQAAEKLAPILEKEVGFVDSFLATRISHRDILLELGNDAVIVAATRDAATRTLPDGSVVDEWGIKYQTVGLYSEAVERPLSSCDSASDLKEYTLPNPHAEKRWDFAAKTTAIYRNDYAIVGDLEACLFELAWNLVGLEKFLIDLYAGEDYVEPLLDRIEEYSTICGLKMVGMGVDMIWAGDDFGTQTNLLISPDLWRRWFKARYAKMFSSFKAANPKLRIAYHSCGAIEPLINEYIEVGVDFLNPIQPAALGMDLSVLFKKYGKRIGFFGGIDVQDVLPHGTVEDVRLEVRRCIDAVEDSSRLILAPAHNIQPDTPVENILAFFEEAQSYRRYKKE